MSNPIEAQPDTQIAISEATDLVRAAMRAVGYTDDEAAIITRQIIDSELRGVPSAGLSRALSLAERTVNGPPARGMTVTRETPVSALIEGGNTCGYLVGHAAMRLGIEKAQAMGVAAVGANDTWYTGMLAHYVEMATDAGLVCFASCSSAPRVAPHGAVEGRFGTNPIAFGIPSDGDPVIFDAGTSSLVMSNLTLASRLGVPLPDGTAFDAEGRPTTDADAALDGGAIKVWGGHRGSGLGIVVQMLGLMVGGHPFPKDNEHLGQFFFLVRPDLFGDGDAFRSTIAEYAEAVRTARTEPGAPPVQTPFERSARTRHRLREQGAFPTNQVLIDQLRELAGPVTR